MNLYFAKISSVNKSGTVNITLTDRENQVVNHVYCLEQEDHMSPGEHVAAIFDDDGHGIVLGKIRKG